MKLALVLVACLFVCLVCSANAPQQEPPSGNQTPINPPIVQSPLDPNQTVDQQTLDSVVYPNTTRTSIIHLFNQCVNRSEAFEFILPVLQYIAPTDANGFVLPQYLSLIRVDAIAFRFPVWNVLSSNNPPELNSFYFNGQYIGFLQGVSNQWVLNSFLIPITMISFAKANPDGTLTPGQNVITINFDRGFDNCILIEWAGFPWISIVFSVQNQNH
eukprot:TRINITY_DN16816_c0_g1_i1.p1 TRINITY_DN16816_c0_g1~~TRINITY_DN16816_c0_g1_i1.p1  ORF type:complete len:215 (-),score=36.74 TRINITY_DN16816_c0_g1_i1:17-661(-)